jgi:hypothetical protein
MKNFAAIALQAAVSFAADPTGFGGTGAEISIAKGTFYQGWNDVSPRIVHKVHNNFEFSTGNTWASSAGEAAEVWSCYRDGSSTYSCVIAAIASPNTGTNTYALT